MNGHNIVIIVASTIPKRRDIPVSVKKNYTHPLFLYAFFFTSSQADPSSPHLNLILLKLETIRRQPAHHELITRRGVIVQVHPVSRVRLNMHFDPPTSAEGGHRAALRAQEIRARTIAPTVNQVSFPSVIQHRSSEGGGAEVQDGLAGEFTHRERIFVRFGVLQDGRIEVGVLQEGELVGVFVPRRPLVSSGSVIQAAILPAVA